MQVLDVLFSPSMSFASALSALPSEWPRREGDDIDLADVTAGGGERAG